MKRTLFVLLTIMLAVPAVATAQHQADDRTDDHRSTRGIRPQHRHRLRFHRVVPVCADAQPIVRDWGDGNAPNVRQYRSSGGAVRHHSRHHRRRRDRQPDVLLAGTPTTEGADRRGSTVHPGERRIWVVLYDDIDR